MRRPAAVCSRMEVRRPAAARERTHRMVVAVRYPRLAAEVGGRSVRGRKAERLVAATRASVLDPEHSPGRRDAASLIGIRVSSTPRPSGLRRNSPGS